MRKLPLEIQTLYAELVERLTAFEAARTIGSIRGNFQTKHVKGIDYYYFQYYEPGGSRPQVYIGRRDAVLDKVVADYEEAKADTGVERESIERLCALLRAGEPRPPMARAPGCSAGWRTAGCSTSAVCWSARTRSA